MLELVFALGYQGKVVYVKDASYPASFFVVYPTSRTVACGNSV